jgi:hypothetical protein
MTGERHMLSPRYLSFHSIHFSYLTSEQFDNHVWEESGIRFVGIKQRADVFYSWGKISYK